MWCAHSRLEMWFTSRTRLFRCCRSGAFVVPFDVGTDPCWCLFAVVRWCCCVYIPEWVCGMLKLSSDNVVFVIGISHRSSRRFLCPFRIILLFFTTSNLSFDKMTLQSSSHSWPSAIRDALFKLGRTYAFCAFFVSSSDNGSWPDPVDRRLVLSGCCTTGPFEDS